MSEENQNSTDGKSEIQKLIRTISEWVDSDTGKLHNNFILAMIVTLRHSRGIVPTVEKRSNGGFLILWPGEEKDYGVMLMPDGSIANVCKEQDGRIFATTKVSN